MQRKYQKNTFYKLATTMLVANFWSHMASAADVPKTEISDLGAMGVVKEVCSAVFISGRNPQEFLDNSSKFWMSPEDKQNIKDVKVDRKSKTVTLKLGSGIAASAGFYGDQGCINLIGKTRPVTFEPGAVQSTLPPARTKAWPMGDDLAAQNWPADVDKTGVARALDLAFPSDARTAAFLVLYKGQLIAERYGAGASKDMPLPGWSMTKSLQATWVGILASQGKLDLYAPVPIAEWAGATDPRRTISWADLLRMSSGIACDLGRGWFDYADWKAKGYTDNLYVFMGPEDSYSHSVSRPAGFPPRTHWEYTNCQPLVVGKALSQTLKAMGSSIHTWPKSALYDRIGIRSMVVEPDRTGHLLTAAYSYATARDWARLGLLYQQDGLWNGKRILSPDFMSFVRAPAPAAEQPTYGGQVWLNLAGAYPSLPRDAYWFAGIEAQRVIVVPSYDLVIVRLGHGVGEDPAGPRPSAASLSVDAAASALMSAIHRPDVKAAQEVEGVVDAFFKALSVDDEAAYRATVSDDFRVYESDGRPYTTDELLAVVRARPAKRTWLLSQPRTVVDGRLATTTYRNTGIFIRNGVREVHEWTETAVLQRYGQSWKMSLLNSNALKVSP